VSERVAAAIAIALACGAAAGACRSDRAEQAARACEAGETAAFLDANRARYLAAIARARTWLDGLDIDPIELRRRNVKGKKKLTEQLDAYNRLYEVAPVGDRPAMLDRIRRVVAITYEPQYHDLAGVDDLQFKQDATSYLRTAVVMQRLGLDTTRYREEIRKIHPRLDAHLASRGPNQRLAFHLYYGHFGLAEPFPLATALEQGVIARRAAPGTLSQREVYDLTHEIFVPYEYGERLDAEPFGAADREYLREALTFLTGRYVEQRDADLVAELISCLRYLRFVEEPVYRRGLELLLASQHGDGAWGDLERARQGFGELGREGMLLHTTLVVVSALTIAFHEPWNPRRGC
jgi:hypothetical protein